MRIVVVRDAADLDARKHQGRGGGKNVQKRASAESSSRMMAKRGLFMAPKEKREGIERSVEDFVFLSFFLRKGDTFP